MRSNACHFKGIDAVVKAYIMQDIPAWSIGNGATLMFKYAGSDIAEGEQQLRQTLEALAVGGSSALYSLRVYEDFPGGKIKSNTPWDASFNFYAFEDESMLPFQQGRASMSREMDNRLKAMEESIRTLADREEETEEVSGTQKMIAGLLSSPEIKNVIAQAVGSITARIFGPARVGQVAGIPEQKPVDDASGTFEEAWAEFPEEQRAKVSEAVRRLMPIDPLLGDHLLKLSELPPAKYAMALSFL
jgi:hypothetical protein